jgi:hypothetical protein
MECSPTRACRQSRVGSDSWVAGPAVSRSGVVEKEEHRHARHRDLPESPGKGAPHGQLPPSASGTADRGPGSRARPDRCRVGSPVGDPLRNRRSHGRPTACPPVPPPRERVTWSSFVRQISGLRSGDGSGLIPFGERSAGAICPGDGIGGSTRSLRQARGGPAPVLSRDRPDRGRAVDRTRVARPSTGVGSRTTATVTPCAPWTHRSRPTGCRWPGTAP